MSEEINNGFVLGFAAVAASLARDYDQPGIAADIIANNGFELDDFKKARVEPFDMKHIRKLFRTESRLERRGHPR